MLYMCSPINWSVLCRNVLLATTKFTLAGVEATNKLLFPLKKEINCFSIVILYLCSPSTCLVCVQKYFASYKCYIGKCQNKLLISNGKKKLTASLSLFFVRKKLLDSLLFFVSIKLTAFLLFFVRNTMLYLPCISHLFLENISHLPVFFKALFTTCNNPCQNYHQSINNLSY